MDAVFDQQYLERLIARDPGVEEHFVRHFGELIRMVVTARTGSRRLVEDVRQETFLRVLEILRKQGGLERPDRLGSFVYSVCRRVLAEQLRQQGPTSEGRGLDGSPEPAYRMLIDERLVRQEHKRRLEGLLKELTPVERKALRMVFWEDRDRGEVCAELGLSQDYLRVVLWRAKARLRRGLGALERRFRSKSNAYRPQAARGETLGGPKITGL